jgi:hypothetical protein
VPSNDPLPREFYAEHWGRMPAPKFSTPRDFSAPTRGGNQAEFARIWMRQPFMPAQRYIADVTGELRLNEAGIWVPRYTLNVILIQRQGGKSHMSMARNGERSFSVPNWRAWYTAQTGQDARDEFLKFYEERVKGTPLDRAVHLNKSRGGEQLVFRNGSTIRPVPPTEEKLHGKQSDSTDIDEGWAFDKEHGRLLIQAGGPTKLTRPQAQTFIWSAGGTAASTWLAEYVAKGRAGAEGICYIEFGIPEGADPEDLDLIAAHHPAYGHTITMDGFKALRLDMSEDAAGWARAAGNVWSEVIGGAIGTKLWETVRATDPIPDRAPVGYGVARSEDGTQVVIAVAAQVGDHVVGEVLDVLPTSFGAHDHVKAWATDGPVAVDPSGPSSGIYEKLPETIGNHPVIGISTRSYSGACTNLVDALPHRGYLFRKHPALDDAVKVAGLRNIGDGGKVWARVAAGAPIAALEAVTLASHALAHRAPTGKPMVRFAS